MPRIALPSTGGCRQPIGTATDDSPLRPVPGRDPQERLHEGVKGLNRGQVERLLVFRRDGTGEGVTWQARQGQ